MCVCERGPHVGALTFDDDLPHVEVVAPILRRANLPAAFFLCGASLDRPQPFWWHDLQVVVDQRGASPSRLRSLPELDLTPAIRRVPHAVHEVAEHIERMPPERRSAVAEEPRSHAGKPRRALSARGVDRLSAAGFEIGFHARRHDLLWTLDDDALSAAMTDGRDLLEAAVGRAFTMIAHPHGKADGRAAGGARAAGYELGLTGSPTRVDPTTDPLLIGRVEAQALTLRDFAAALAAILAAEDRKPARA
jgi:peptidoglycan/xylan/chitin deacetylase (PgdA/CDA1 family)